MAIGLDKLQDMVIQMLEKPKIFVFADILDLPSVKRLKSNQEFKRYYNTVKLFAYGTFERYMELKDTIEFVELTPAMVKKLRYLSIVDMASEKRLIPYDLLLEKLKMKTVRQLEDFLIEAMFHGVIEGCMQQSKNLLCITNIVVRDAEHRGATKRLLSDKEETPSKKPRTEEATGSDK